ncbi:hypothetical protein [Kordia jejudonensis]|uniref:hypothetical protein n=1 Tax=Kordia jejudonensis TaxID=1348245 RepID=UPI0012E01989|nr:hypothetical protein [Kordia jejudonensis]
MKKRNLKNLVLNKKSISNFDEEYEKVKGGRTINQTCAAVGTWHNGCRVCHEV